MVIIILHIPDPSNFVFKNRLILNLKDVKGKTVTSLFQLHGPTYKRATIDPRIYATIQLST